MNLLLFEPGEWKRPLDADDPRAVHIRTILKSKPGDLLDAGERNGLIGKALIREIRKDGGLVLEFEGERESPPLCPLTLIIGTPRPPTAKRLLRDLSAAGIERIVFTGTDLGEKSYLTSRLWSREEWKDAVDLGMAQGESTLMPAVDKYYSLYRSIDSLPEDTDRLALDNVSPLGALKSYKPAHSSCCLALGPERGWSDRERDILRERGFRHLLAGKPGPENRDGRPYGMRPGSGGDGFYLEVFIRDG